MTFVAEQFLAGFALPLVQGGEVHVGRPLDAEDLHTLQTELVITTTESSAVAEARTRRAARLWLYPVPGALTGPELALLAGVHNLLFMSHPRAGSFGVGARGEEQLQSYTRRLLAQQVPQQDEGLVARHTLLGSLSGLTRVDVELSYWAGSYTFEGRRPPARLLRWRGLRRVREARTTVRWVDTDLSRVQLELLVLALAQSPLTDALTPLRQVPPFSWVRIAPLLQRPALARLVAHRYLELGLERIGPALATALWTDARRAAEPGVGPALRTAAGLVGYLYASLALGRGAPDEPPGVVPGAPEESLAGVLVAAQGCGLVPAGPALGLAETRVGGWVEAVRGGLGQDLAALSARLQHAVAP